MLAGQQDWQALFHSIPFPPNPSSFTARIVPFACRSRSVSSGSGDQYQLRLQVHQKSPGFPYNVDEERRCIYGWCGRVRTRRRCQTHTRELSRQDEISSCVELWATDYHRENGKTTIGIRTRDAETGKEAGGSSRAQHVLAMKQLFTSIQRSWSRPRPHIEIASLSRLSDRLHLNHSTPMPSNTSSASNAGQKLK